MAHEIHKTNGSAVINAQTGIGIAMSFILTSQIYPFMLSSAFTARTIVQEKNQVDEVLTDMTWALGLSIASTAVIAYFMHDDWKIFVIGSVFSTVLYLVYMYRGQMMNAGALAAFHAIV